MSGRFDLNAESIVALCPSFAVKELILFFSIIEALKQYGLWHGTIWIWYRLLDKIGIKICEIAVGAVANRAERKPEIPDEFSFRLIPHCQIDRFENVYGLSKDFLSSVVERNDFFLGIFHGEEMVGYRFASFSDVQVTKELTLVVPDGFRYSYKAWVHPDHRKIGLSKASAWAFEDMLPLEFTSCRWIWYADKSNFPSRLRRRQHPNHRPLRMGFVGWFSWFPIPDPFTSRRAKWVGTKLIRAGDSRDIVQLGASG